MAWAVLWRALVAVVSIVVWLTFLLLAEAVDSSVTGAFFVLAAMAFPPLVTFSLMAWPAESGLLGGVGFIAGLFAAFGSLLIVFGFPSWYVARHGTAADALVTAHRCVDSDRTDCGPQFRVMLAATEEDLGWAGCRSRHWDDGAQIIVRTDRYGLFRPEIEGCADKPFPPAFVVFLFLGAGVLAFTASSFGVPRRRPSPG